MLQDIAPESVLEPSPADGMRSVDPEGWDAIVAPGQAPLSHGYVSAWELAELPGLELRPLLAHEPDTGRLAAAAPAYFYDLDMATVHSPFLAGAVEALRRVLPRALIAKALEIGSSAPLVPPFLRAPGVSVHDAASAILREGIEEAERRGAHMVIVQNFEAGQPAAQQALVETGFMPIPIPPTVVVDLPFASFDEYLGAMRAQYRRRARKTIEASEHLRVEHLRGFGQLAPELARQWRLVYDRAQEVKREILGPDYFRRVAELDRASVLLLRRPDDSIASFALLLDDEPWLHFLFTGFAEEAGREESAYFRLLYEIVRVGIDGNFNRINLGITTVRPKLDVGGVPVPLCGWLYQRRPLLRRAYAALARGPFKPHRFEPRNVFKD